MANEILVVDDNSDIRLLISNILKDKGFIVRQAANFDQALNENQHLKDGLNIDKKDVPNILVREALDSLLN